MRFNWDKIWYGPRYSLVVFCLLPFSWLFQTLVFLRRFFYKLHCFPVYRAPVPVIVVGNLSIGGTGKTPMVIWLSEMLRSQGLQPGIVSRGYGGVEPRHPHLVQASDAASWVGDEVLLLKERTHCPLVICKNRAKAVQFLLQQTKCDVVISDDGLQHYRLHREMEIVMVDGVRRFGNQHLLPAGPLREPMKRAQAADFIVMNGGDEKADYQFHLHAIKVYKLGEPVVQWDLKHFHNQTVHAVSGIAHPARFFTMLQQAGLTIIQHAFPDHHQFIADDLQFNDGFCILMTEKDAVKCREFVRVPIFVVAIEMWPNAAFIQALENKLKKHDF